MVNEAELYNKVKKITFSLLNKDGETKAYNYLKCNKSVLPIKAWKGLKAELDFYVGYKNKYCLTPSLDYGIKCDFTGTIEKGQMCRIDVTTNINFKKLKDYDPILQRDKMIYKIVVMNETGKLDDIFDLNFLPDNHGGKLFDVALFMPTDYNSQGDTRNNPYQRIVTVSSATGLIVEEKEIVTDWYLQDIHNKMIDLYEYYEDNDVEEDLVSKELGKYLEDSAKLLSKTTELNIVACGQTNREIIDPRTCEDEEITRIYWKHPVIEEWIGDIIEEW